MILSKSLYPLIQRVIMRNKGKKDTSLWQS